MSMSKIYMEIIPIDIYLDTCKKIQPHNRFDDSKADDQISLNRNNINLWIISFFFLN